MRQHRYCASYIVTMFLSLAIVLLSALPATADSTCDELWTIAGQGTEKPWQRSNGYRIGMSKQEAQQIRRTGLRDSLAQDEWTFMLSAARVVLVFEDGKLASASLIVEGAKYEDAYRDSYEMMGVPDDFGQDYLLWRNEECDAVKLVQDMGGDVHVVLQSFDYFRRNSVNRK